MRKKATLCLADGSQYSGTMFGACQDVIGELVFNLLVLVGAVKASDRIVKEMMGL